jgi:hypothetical protein
MYIDDWTIYIDLPEGEQLSDALKRDLVDRVFRWGGDGADLLPAYLTGSIAQILELDHGSILQAAIEEAVACPDEKAQASFFYMLGTWLMDMSHEDLAEMHRQSACMLDIRDVIRARTKAGLPS